MKKKSFIILILTMFLVLSFGFTAFAGGRKAAEEEKKILLGFANMVEGYDFSTWTREGIEEEVAKRGWDILLLDNNFDANTALSNADTMVLKGIDIAVEFQLYEDIMPALMEKFNAANIPVITIDIPAPGATFVGADNYESGKVAGVWLGEYAKKNWGGEVDLVLLLDDPTVGELPKMRVDGELDGILEVLPNLPKDKILRQPGGGMREKGMEITRAVLTAHPDAHRILITGMDDISTLGALAAAEILGREDDIIIFSYGGEGEAIDLLKEKGHDTAFKGSIGLFFENYGKFIVSTAEKILKGEDVPEFVYVDHAPITADNVRDYYPD